MSKIYPADQPVTETFDQHAGLQRWSTRKRAAREAVETLPAAPNIEPTHPKPVLTDADMPPLASLTEKSDYSGFFSAGVSEGLRRLALRKLFHSKAFNVTDGLDDYAEDFTKFAKLGDIITQDLRHRMAVEAERLARSTPDKPAATAAQQSEPLQPDATSAASSPTLQT